MHHLLLAKGLWGYVDSTEKLAEDASMAVKADFSKMSQKAFSTIIMAISTSQLYLVTSYDQPKDAWNKLCEHFECKTLANKLYLKKQYFRNKMREGTSIKIHLKHMKEISDKLAAIPWCSHCRRRSSSDIVGPEPTTELFCIIIIIIFA